jgi:hypothetical protein
MVSFKVCIRQHSQKIKVYTFSCINEGSLQGRHVYKEEQCFIPGKVDIEGQVVQLSAGDSHSMGLILDSHEFALGTFRDSTGDIGLNKQ